jgi:hypothetical protein
MLAARSIATAELTIISKNSATAIIFGMDLPNIEPPLLAVDKGQGTPMLHPGHD